MTSTYPSYKPTPIPWLPQIPDHWELIGFNFLFRDNKEKNKGMKESLVLSLSYGNIIRKQKNENFGLIPESFETYQVLNPGYIVLRLTDLQNDKRSLRVGYVKERGIITSAYTGLVPNKTDSRYYYYFLHYLDIKKHFYSLGGGVRQSSDYNELKKDKLPLPPLPEQTAIANYLDAKTDEINTFIAKKQKLIALLKEQKQAIINELLQDKDGKWEKRKLKYVAKINSAKSNSNIKLKEEDRVVFLPMERVSENGEIDCTLLKPYSELKNGFTFFEKGDIIIAKITPCFENGKGALLENLPTDVGFGSTEFHTIRANKKKILPHFLKWLVFNQHFRSLGEYFMVGSAGQKRVPSEFISNFVIALPDLEEQQIVLTAIQRETTYIDNAVLHIEKEIELVKELKQSLIAEVVTGKIKVIS